MRVYIREIAVTPGGVWKWAVQKLFNAQHAFFLRKAILMDSAVDRSVANMMLSANWAAVEELPVILPDCYDHPHSRAQRTEWAARP